jgi:two-component system CheB/CheR fusion protein
VESANEELQSSNEEIISSNEELQSTNEELQSLNEELHTVNAEHQLKIKELIELNDDLNNYFQNSYVGQLMIDDKMRIRKFSPSVTGQINLIENDIGRLVTDISVNFAHINFVNEIKTVMKAGQAIEKEIVLNNGRSFLMRVAPYVRLDGSKEGVVVNFIDVSEVKGLNEIVQGVFNSSPNGIVALKAIKNGDDKITDFEIIAANNNSMQVLDGETNIVGKKILKEQELNIAGYFDAFVTVVDNGVPFHGEYKNVHTGKWYEVDAIRMRNGLVATFTDTTQKKEAADTISGSFLKLKNNAEELKVMNSKLEQTNYDLLQFASVASHDLKEPLRKIQVYGNFLKDKMVEDPTAHENKYIEKIISASNRMQILIDDVLTLSKLSNSEFAMAPVNLDDIIGQITDDVDITIKEKRAEVKRGELGEVSGVRGQMRQLFQNLILNSLKFNNKDNPKVFISRKGISKEEAKAYGIDAAKYVCIEVADNGIGFEDQFSDKIFGLFQRLNGNIYQGTGIGLSICKKIVDNHKGFISAKGKPGEGATFRILLPLAQAN